MKTGGKVIHWTEKEDNWIREWDITSKDSMVDAKYVATHIYETRNPYKRSLNSIYQRVLKLLSSKRSFKKSKKREKPTHVVTAKTVKEVNLPQGMSLDFTGKRITISDTYIKIYI